MKKARLKRRQKDRDRIPLINKEWETYPLKEKAMTVTFNEDRRVFMIENVNKGQIRRKREGDTACIEACKL